MGDRDAASNERVQAAIYARYSSENQRPESIDDQVASCRKAASERGYEVREEHVFADHAASGVREDRKALAALRDAGSQGAFQVVFVDDLSRLARDNLLMLLLLRELRFAGVRVISVADGLDSDDPEAIIGIHVRGVFNELQLQDLSKKTLRGQMGQKARGFTVGEATFGYRSVPVGTTRLDRKGKLRPEGYRMAVDAAEAAVVLRVFRAFADGLSESAIVRTLNAEGVVGRRVSTKGWSPATVHRMLRNEKYVGRWIWNRMETRRDPRTGRRRQIPKPREKWFITENQTLRIVPEPMWLQVQERLAMVRGTWPGGTGRRGFCTQVADRTAVYPADLLSGSLVCRRCGGSMVKVSGRNGGYYSCLAGARRACGNRLLVRRDVAEGAICAALSEVFAADNAFVGETHARLHQEADEASAAAPAAQRLNLAELDEEQRRVSRLVKLVAEGCQSPAVGAAIAETERKIHRLRSAVEEDESCHSSFTIPSPDWTRARLSSLLELTTRDARRGAQVLRAIVRRIALAPVVSESGAPYYQALPVLAEMSPTDQGEDVIRAGGRRVDLVVSTELRQLIQARLAQPPVRDIALRNLAQLLWSEVRATNQGRIGTSSAHA